MARTPAAAAEVSDFEAQRLANIAERDALLKKLQTEAASAGLYTKPKPANGAGRRHKKTAAPAKRVVKEEDAGPRRTSSRLAGLQADSEVAKRKAEDEYVAVKEAERVKRQRRSGDLVLGEIGVDGRGRPHGELYGTDKILKGVAEPYVRTFDGEDVRKTSDKELRGLREKMSGLSLWGEWEPGRLKITPERIYSMAFHPTGSKALVFAGDKMGHLGIVDAGQEKGIKGEDGEEDVKLKKESSIVDLQDDDEDDADDPDPIIPILKPHTRTISAMHTHPSHPQTLYTASYDSSIRAVDLSKQLATEIYGPSALDSDEPISGIDMATTDPSVIYFTTLNGAFGRHDTRADATNTELYQLSEKKIGGFSLHPLASHYLATASLDRFMRVWDLRKIAKKLPTMVGEHESRLSVSHAAFNSVGQVATSSYDDTIKIHSFGVRGHDGGGKLERMETWKAGMQLDESIVQPEVMIRHNNQTGR